MVDSFKIRKAKISDSASIAEIQIVAFPETIRHYFGEGSSNQKKAESVTNAMYKLLVRSMKDEIFVAEADGKIVGNIMVPYNMNHVNGAMFLYRAYWITVLKTITALAVISSDNRKAMISDRRWMTRFDRSTTRQTIPSRIFNIAVHPDYRNQGIGDALIKAGLHYLFDTRKTDAVTLNVMAENKQAFALYRKFGFKEKERTSNSLGEWIVMVLVKEDRLIR